MSELDTTNPMTNGSELNAIETIAKWRDELRPPQNLLSQVLDAARATFRLRATIAELLAVLKYVQKAIPMSPMRADIEAAIAKAKLTTT